MARRSKTPLQTKRHVARLDREQRQTRYIILATIFVVILVVGLVGYGLLDTFVIKPAQPVVKVGDEVVSAKTFTAIAKFNGQQILNSYLQNMQLAQLLGYDQSYIDSLQQQTETSLFPDVLGNQTLNLIIEDLLIRQEADERGISVTASEIEAAIQNQFGYFPSGTPTAKPTFAGQPTSTLSATQLALTVPTMAIELEATQTEIPLPTNTPTLLPTQSNSPTPTLVPTPTAVPTAYTQELFEDNYSRVVDEYEQEDIPESTIRWVVASQIYRDKVRESVLEGMEVLNEEEQVWARHILVETEEIAALVIERLKNGENFALLAAELSSDTGSAQNGGDLSWFGKNKMVPEFEVAAFALDVGEISDPVQSSFGWHVIQVLGHEDRPFTSSEYEQAKDTMFQDWLEQKRQSTEIEINDFWREIVPNLQTPNSLQ